MYKLIDIPTNREIKIGQTIWSFRGEAWVLEAVYETKVLASKGGLIARPGDGMLFYPSVFNAKILTR